MSYLDLTWATYSKSSSYKVSRWSEVKPIGTKRIFFLFCFAKFSKQS